MDIEIKHEIFSDVARDFNIFLKNYENHRIIFSGKFGSGKTTFLKWFFENPPLNTEDNKYEVFRISPVNYSISGNEDIIELIKYDLITEFLLKPNIEIQTSDIPIQQYVSEKDILSIFQTLISVINYKGIDISKILKGLKKLKADLEKRKSETNEGDTFTIFLDKIERKNGVFERDLVTKMIEKVFDRISKAGGKTLLIIDDIDRVDPEHIFRILNVFSAHFDDEIFQKRGLKNKFGFDKVILVCDYHNIQSLFHSKYGLEADFYGYIDKFYTNTIFQFDVKSQVENYFRPLLYEMDKKIVRRYGSNFQRFGKNELLEKTIIYSILVGGLTIRTLNKLIQADVEEQFSKLNKLYNIRNTNDSNVYSCFLLALNIYLFGNIGIVYKSLERLVNNNINIEIDNYLADLMYKVTSHNNRYSNLKEDEIQTGTETFQFLFNESRDKVASNIIAKGQENATLSGFQILNLMNYFLNTVKQITGLH